jgi:hypothetical protein
MRLARRHGSPDILSSCPLIDSLFLLRRRACRGKQNGLGYWRYSKAVGIRSYVAHPAMDDPRVRNSRSNGCMRLGDWLFTAWVACRSVSPMQSCDTVLIILRAYKYTQAEPRRDTKPTACCLVLDCFLPSSHDALALSPGIQSFTAFSSRDINLASQPQCLQTSTMAPATAALSNTVSSSNSHSALSFRKSPLCVHTSATALPA